MTIRNNLIESVRSVYDFTGLLVRGGVMKARRVTESSLENRSANRN